MEGPLRHQINRPTEQRSQLVLQILDLPAQRRFGGQFVEEVNITAVLGIAACHRAEDLQALDAVAAAQIVKPRSSTSTLCAPIHPQRTVRAALRPEASFRTVTFPRSHRPPFSHPHRNGWEPRHEGAMLEIVEAGVRELRDHLSRYLKLVREGAEVTVTDHGRAVARLVPLDRPRPLERLIAEGIVTPRPAAKQPRTRRPIQALGTVSDLVAEQRR